jgi:hypothetical protein
MFTVRRWTTILSAIAYLGSALWLGAHTFYTTKITWSRDVSRIVYRNCASCHHPGGSSFSLMTYKEARPWAESIKHQVLERRMPPWNAVKGFGDFADDHGLTQEDLEIVGEWVEGGCPEGDPAYMPPVPDFSAPPSSSTVDSAGAIAVYGATTIRRPVEVASIAPLRLPQGGMLQVIALKPDGTIVPLLWIEEFHPDWYQRYYFREPLRFPAGTRIEISPRAGKVVLHLKERITSAQRPAR